MSIQRKAVLGFTLMELLVGIAILGILAAITLPSYLGYVQRSAYSEVVAMADRLKISVAACIDYNSGSATSCNGGSNSIPANITAPGVGLINSATVTAGVITIVPNPQRGITTAQTYIATPTYDSNSGVTWTISGGVCGTGYIQDC